MVRASGSNAARHPFGVPSVSAMVKLEGMGTVKNIWLELIAHRGSAQELW
jgi:hypothetical protein